MKTGWKLPQKEYSYIKIVFLITCLFYSNVIATKYTFFGTILSVVGIVLIYGLLLSGKITCSYLVYLAFLTSTIEIQDFVYGYDATKIGVVHNFLIFPKLNLLPVYIYNVILFIILTLKCNKAFFFQIRLSKKTYFLYVWSWIIFISGIIATLMTFMTNDNNIASLPWYFGKLKPEFFRMSMIFLTFQINSILLVKIKNYEFLLKQFAKCIFVSLTIASLLSIISGFRGYYGIRTDILLMPLFSFFSILQFIFILYNKNRISQCIFFMSGTLTLFLMLNYSSPIGGKWLLVVMLVPFVFFIKNLIIKNPWKYVGILIFTLLGILFIINLRDIVKMNTLLEYKYQQAIETISIFSPDWYKNLSASPKFRIDEFINVCIEYINKPVYSIMGKGFAGSIVQHTTTLNWANPGAFSSEQVMAGRYINLHESINLLFLKHGLLGLFYFFAVIWIGIKNFLKSQWIIVGLVWWALFYGCYNTMLFGAALLGLGFWEADIAEETKCNPLYNRGNFR